MPGFLYSLMRSFIRKLKLSEVNDPKARKHQKSAERKEPDKLERSKLKDFINGSSKSHHSPKQQSCSPKSRGKGDILNPITHSIGEIKLFQCCPRPPQAGKDLEQPQKSIRPATSSGKTDHVYGKDCNFSLNSRVFFWENFHDPSSSMCYICGRNSEKLDAVEKHHISGHSGNDL
ncbi:hypothetical protein L6164_036475 [Bauhinia variegata]|uniref:Uncharacterized protein n=1 Tax=Bauhinia variegata TaxID=167791 RepID=A0ACB9KHB8_BAUVA|nr:hypothetical protein L6164_036475 [Bauhinia variegata]